jgi:hypothetical protein
MSGTTIAATVVVCGLGLGWVAASPLAGLMSGELHGVSTDGVAARVVVAGLLAAISVAALVSPAWRAAGRNLSELLRTET